MHLILPTSYRSQSSCTEFARQIGLPWPACPLPTRGGEGGARESPLSPGKAWSQEKVASSGLCREWGKKPNVVRYGLALKLYLYSSYTVVLELEGTPLGFPRAARALI